MQPHFSLPQPLGTFNLLSVPLNWPNIFYVSEIIWLLSFCAWLFSSGMLSRLIHVEYISELLFPWLMWISQCPAMTFVYSYCILVDGTSFFSPQNSGFLALWKTLQWTLASKYLSCCVVFPSWPTAHKCSSFLPPLPWQPVIHILKALSYLSGMQQYLLWIWRESS